ncbi:MAG TPA: hypothetical protein V6C84_25195 [Coleofasciculaceae cyanobacterium]
MVNKFQPYLAISTDYTHDSVSHITGYSGATGDVFEEKGAEWPS